MPFARHIGMVAGIFEQGGHGYYVITEYPLIIGLDPLLRGQHFGNIGDTG